MIVDEVTISLEAGAGGNGCLSFRREKYIPRGGPDGGNGGRGGDIYLESRNDVRTLVDFLYRPLYRARHGEHGKGKNKHGRDADPIVIRVPVGTMVWTPDHTLLADMNLDGLRILAAKGGRGGRGNTTFATSTSHAPRLAEKGEPGEKIDLRLELKLLADVGIVGFPNAGKSTLLSRLTKARPKIADYPFTTLEPQLGVAFLPGDRSFVLADVPGLIEGASQGKGLGIRFLKHLERTKVLIHLIDAATLSGFSELVKSVKTINRELYRHSVKFKKIPQIIALTKADAISNRETLNSWVKMLGQKGTCAFVISSVSGEGLRELLEEAWNRLELAPAKPSTGEERPREILYRTEPRFIIKSTGGTYRVSGKEVEKWVSMTNFENPDAVERFHKILGRMGIIKALKKMGVREGDTVFLGKEEMVYRSDRVEDCHGK